MKVGVKHLQCAIENVWGFVLFLINLVINSSCGILFKCIDHSRMFYHLNSLNGTSDITQQLLESLSEIAYSAFIHSQNNS